ncbi:integral component of membrane [Sergentomyia squamirostris]
MAQTERGKPAADVLVRWKDTNPSGVLLARNLLLSLGPVETFPREMVSRRKILSRSRDDLNLDHSYHQQQEDEEDVWYQKEKLYKAVICMQELSGLAVQTGKPPALVINMTKKPHTGGHIR